MTTESTAPISFQRSTVLLINELIGLFPELPAPYIVIHKPWQGEPSALHFQLPTPTAFEQWRTALGITPGAVSLHPYGANSWVKATTFRDGTEIEISSHGIILTADQLEAPRDRDEVAA
ncbi:hypothetical protein [Streptomyces sp. NPDC091215]|uniref:hypothetical protein n=1 Tax=Streptomyces sp. NPDC091215 TaxID=3155192 RepID=UPI00341A9D64